MRDKHMRGMILALVLIILLIPTLTTIAADKEIEVFFNDPYTNRKDRSIQTMILNDLERADERIDLATYNYSDSKTADLLIKKAKAGVEVNLVIDEENYDDDVVRNMKKGGVNVVKAVSEGLMHSKYIIIDDDITISGSANMTQSSFSYDNNFMIRVVSEEMASIFRAEFEEMFYDQKFGAESPHRDAAAGITLNDGAKVYVRFSPDDHVDDLIEELIDAAQQSVYVLAYSFASKDISEQLMEADEDGLDVIVICEDSKAYRDGGGQCGPLAEAGVPVYMDGYDDILMHEKVLILDRSVVIAGSYNLTRSADRKNDEQILLIQDDEIAEAFLAEFNKIRDQAK